MKKHYYIMSHQHSCSVVVSFQVEEDTKQGSNPGRSKNKKSPSLATQGVVVVTQWVVVGTARPYRVKEWFEGFIGRFG